MANGLMPLAGLCALFLTFCGCSSGGDSDQGSAGVGGNAAPPSGESGGGELGSAGRTASSGGDPAAGGPPHSEGGTTSAGSGGMPRAGAQAGPPPAIEGRSVYALECHGQSKDCQVDAVPCFGVASATPRVAAGWACANRCTSDTDCSDAPSGAEARASCVSFTSAGHCVLVCKNESESFSCPVGMTCYAAEKSPVGYCLWQ